MIYQIPLLRLCPQIDGGITNVPPVGPYTMANPFAKHALRVQFHRLSLPACTHGSGFAGSAPYHHPIPTPTRRSHLKHIAGLHLHLTDVAQGLNAAVGP